MKNSFKVTTTVICLGMVCLFTSASFAQNRSSSKIRPFKVRTIIVDAGHGGKDPGAHGAYSSEKKITLSIAKKLRDAIEDRIEGVKVVMTRTDDHFIELHRRSDIANRNNGNLFISIHCNASPERFTHEKGVMLLVYGLHRKGEQMEALRENASIYQEKDYKKNYESYSEKDPTNLIILNAYMQKYRKQSILFGDLLEHQFVYNDNRKSIGVREQGVLVLAHSAMPAVLVETGFINNHKEEDYLNSKAGQAEIVNSIILAIKKYRSQVNAE